MPTLSYTTAGESHGPGLLAWIDGLPQGLELDLEFIDNELRRRHKMKVILQFMIEN